MVTLFEKGFHKNLGFTVSVNEGLIRKDAFWFGEAQSRIVITVQKSMLETVMAQIQNAGISAEMLGTVTSGEIHINGIDFGNISAWKEKYDTAIENILKEDKDFQNYLTTFMGTDFSAYQVRKSMGKDFTKTVYDVLGINTFKKMIEIPPNTKELKDPQLYLKKLS